MANRLEDCACFKEIAELFELLAQLSEEDRNKVYGVAIGINIANKIKNTA